jgi:hypothetical protein
MMMNFDLFTKPLYQAKVGVVIKLKLPDRLYVTFDGQGKPGSPEFVSGIQCLYAVVYTLKMGLKHGLFAPPSEYEDYKVKPLEGLWWQADGSMATPENLKDISWKLMILVPHFISQTLFVEALNQALKKKPDLPLNRVNFESFPSKTVIQTLHMGSYAIESKTVQLLLNYAKEHRLEITGRHHEIYLSDPGRTAPEKLKTILRYAVVG